MVDLAAAGPGFNAGNFNDNQNSWNYLNVPNHHQDSDRRHSHSDDNTDRVVRFLMEGNSVYGDDEPEEGSRKIMRRQRKYNNEYQTKKNQILLPRRIRSSSDASAFSSRQDVNDLNWIANMATNAFQVFSLVSNLVGPGAGTSSGTPTSEKKPQKASNPDRIDTDATVTTSDGDDIDLAMGTLMAYGGKYLREMVKWAWELGTSTPVESIGTNTISEKVDTVQPQKQQQQQQQQQQAVAQSTQQVVKISPGSAVNPLQLLSPAELESLGLKAVGAGANPLRLQQAFATAQIDKDWSELEGLIKAALGPNSIPNKAGGGSSTLSLGGGGGRPSRPSSNVNSNKPSVSTVQVPISSVPGGTASAGGGILSGITSTLSQATSFVNNLIGAPTGVNKIGEAATGGAVQSTSTVPTGIGYYTYMANSYIERMEKVIEGPDPKFPSDDPMDASVLTRFIKEFELQKEALAVQYSLNNIVSTVNDFIGSDEAEDKVGHAGNRPSSPTSSSTTSASDDTGGVLGLITRIPQTLGGMAASALKFISPGKPAAQNKLGVAANAGGSTPTYSQTQVMNAGNALTLGALGAAAVGTVLWGVYASPGANRRHDHVDPVEKRLGHPYMTNFDQDPYVEYEEDPYYFGADEPDNSFYQDGNLNTYGYNKRSLQTNLIDDLSAKIYEGYSRLDKKLKHCDRDFNACLELNSNISSKTSLEVSNQDCRLRRRKCFKEVFKTN